MLFRFIILNVTAVTKSGSANATYNTLKAIIDGKIGSVMNDGIENAGFVKWAIPILI